MSKPNAVINIIPDDIACQDDVSNQVQAFLAAMKDILNNQCRMMVDKDNYVDKEKVDEMVEKIRGVRFKVISPT